MAIRLVSGNEDAGPEVDVAPAGPQVEMTRINVIPESRGRAPVFREQALEELTTDELNRANAIEIAELVSKPELPPAKTRTPTLQAIPPTFVARDYSKVRGNYDITGLDAGRIRSRTVPASAYVSSYLLDEPPAELGRVVEIEIGEKVASIGQNVFVRMEREARIGERFSVGNIKGKIKDGWKRIGPVIEPGGTIEITGVIDESKRTYRAAVLMSVNPILLGSVLLEGELPKVTFTRTGTLLNVDVRVIGGEFDESRKLLGESAAIYLDGGARAGLSVGDLLPVQSRRGARHGKSEFPDLRRSIGILKIVKVEPTVATAVVIEAHDEVTPGDRTGGGLPETLRSIDYTGGAQTDID